MEQQEQEFNNDKKENQRIKQENLDLIKKNNELENEIKKKQSEYNNLVSEIGSIYQENQSKIKKELNPNLSIIKSAQNPRSVPSKKTFDPLSEYKFPTLIGLNNIGATCFMNSTLQCLSQTKALTQYFLNEKNLDRIVDNNIALKNRNDLQLCTIYLDLINKLWEKNGRNKSFSPNKFMETIEKMNPLFKQGQAGDSKDFIIFILEQFHKELKKSLNKTPNNSETKKPLNQYDKNNALNYFFDEFKEETSIISDTFFGFNETTNECLNCKNNFNSKGLNNPICYNYGIFNCLIFPLEEVKKMKNMSMSNNNLYMNNNNRVSIYECFFYNQKTDLFTGQNQNYCNVCKQLSDSLYTCRIFSSPNVLILILNRGKDNIYDVKLDFTETIDISDYVLQRDTPRLVYNLYGVITHIGQSGPSAHFVASCKSPIDNKWYRYNDAMVNPIYNIQKEIIDFGTPYILFYQRK